MTRVVTAGTTVIDQFPGFDYDGYTKVTGLTGFGITVWKDAVVQAGVSPTITEIGVSGEYKLETEIPAGENGFWRVEVLIDYNKDVQAFEYVAGAGDMADIYDKILEILVKSDQLLDQNARLLGLNHENICIDETLFNNDGQLTQARVRLYDSKANCVAAQDGGTGTTGLIGTYTLTNVWDTVNEFKIFKQVREP